MRGEVPSIRTLSCLARAALETPIESLQERYDSRWSSYGDPLLPIRVNMHRTRTRTPGRLQHFLPERAAPKHVMPRKTALRKHLRHIHLAAGGREAVVAIRVTEKPMLLMDLMPVAYALSDALTRITKKKVRASGQCIACDKCETPACCRYLVALSTIEAAYLARKLLCEQPYKARGFAKKCRDRSQLLDDKISEFSQNYPETQPQPAEYVKQLEKWYATQQLDCAFLVNKQCSLYADRPLVCREWHVADLASHCRPTGVAPRHLIAAPLSLSDVLAETASHYSGRNELVLLPAVVGWYERHQKVLRKQYPATGILDTFLGCVQACIEKQDKPALSMRVEHLP